MLKRVEVKNFESHEHAVLDLSDGFNLVVGPSNAGKSALLRAIRLAAYGEWDPESLRKGAKVCEVTVTTDKGVVNVKRGASMNEWEVTPDGKPTKKFSRPGKGVVEDAAEVIGLRVVKLGTQEIRPNVMDQLEGHFLMAEIEGESTSGSTRAQVIDEISGLAGMEGLIREVNLDNVRNAREIKESETSTKDLDGKLHDQALLDAEKIVIESSEKLVTEFKEARQFAEDAHALHDEYQTSDTDLKRDIATLKTIPNTALAEAAIQTATERLAKASEVRKSIEQARVASESIRVASDTLKGIPNTAQAESDVQTATEKLALASEVNEVLGQAKSAADAIQTAQTALSAVPDASKAGDLLEKARKSAQEAQEARKALGSAQTVSDDLDALVSENNEVGEALKEAEDAMGKAQAEIEICPICLGPRHEGCGKHRSDVAKLVSLAGEAEELERLKTVDAAVVEPKRKRK